MAAGRGVNEQVDCLTASSSDRDVSNVNGPDTGQADEMLIDSLQQVTEPMLVVWLAHSQTLRLSVLERITDEDEWAELVSFIMRYGHDLFTQYFLNAGNLRAILHQGVEVWLDQLLKQPDHDELPSFIEHLDRDLPRAEAVEHLGLILEAIVENYSEYCDYNSTTTQSDRGEMLYTLLDFLRLVTSYDRVAWNLRPLFSAHETLVQRGRDGAAGLWRNAVAQRTSEIADEHLKRLAQLIRHHGMRLPSIADRLGERFIRPLIVDRLRSLVAPAVKERLAGGKTPSFDLLETEIGKLTAEPSGVGFEIPPWLDALEEEAARVSTAGPEEDDILHPYPALPEIHLTLKAAQRQIREWDESHG